MNERQDHSTHGTSHSVFDDACQWTTEFLYQQTGVRVWLVADIANEPGRFTKLYHHGGGEPAEYAALAEEALQRMTQQDSASLAPAGGTRFLAYLTDERGSRIGVLCGLDLLPPHGALDQPLRFVEFAAKTLGTLWSLERRWREVEFQREHAVALALLDELTGLLNRRGWERLATHEVDRCRRHCRSWTVFSVDIDGLKQVNDRRGHAAGDHLLRAAGAALKSSLRQHDLAARIGGDEFAVLAVECDASFAQQIGDRIAASLQSRGVLATIGFATGSGDDTWQATMQAADLAMIAAKRQRREPTVWR